MSSASAVFKAFQGQFTIIEVNEIAEDATFREVYSDSTSLEFTILENKVCESVSRSLQVPFIETNCDPSN